MAINAKKSTTSAKENIFSKHLKQYLKEHGITVAELAAEIGMDRVTVYRYIKGDRIPSEIKIVELMLDALRMRSTERIEVLEKYERVQMGDQIIDSYKYVEKLMNDLNKISQNSNEKEQTWQKFVKMPLEDEIISLTSAKDIEMCAAAFFENIVKTGQENRNVSILMQPTYETLQKLMVSSFSDKNVKVEQIICLEQSSQDNYRNLEVFRQLLPTCFSNMDYQVRYYYSLLPEHINEMSWMPNMILTDVGVLQFDYRMEKGIFVRNKIYLENMKSQYINFQKHSSAFLKKSEGLDCAQQLYEAMLEDFKASITEGEQTVNTLFVQPCLGMCVSSDIYDKYLYPSPIKEEFTKGMAATRGDWDGLEHLHYGENLPLKTIAYFKLDGLRDFMETGRIREFPTAFYEPISIEDRKICIQRMFMLLKEGSMKYHVVSDSIKMPMNICFYLKGERTFINMVAEDTFVQIQITERGIGQVFFQYIEYLRRKNWLYDEETSMELLNDFLTKNEIDR